jgi:hypothetical protein
MEQFAGETKNKPSNEKRKPKGEIKFQVTLNNEQKEAKHYRKDKHRKRSYEQGKQIKYCDDHF